jgi:hypothetical protein
MLDIRAKSMIFIERKEQTFGLICSEAVPFHEVFNIIDIVSVNMLLRLTNLKGIFLKTNIPNRKESVQNSSSISIIRRPCRIHWSEPAKIIAIRTNLFRKANLLKVF